jgi:hypothetical protein
MEVTFIFYAHGSQLVLSRLFWDRKFHFDDFYTTGNIVLILQCHNSVVHEAIL